MAALHHTTPMSESLHHKTKMTYCVLACKAHIFMNGSMIYSICDIHIYVCVHVREDAKYCMHLHSYTHQLKRTVRLQAAGIPVKQHKSQKHPSPICGAVSQFIWTDDFLVGALNKRGPDSCTTARNENADVPDICGSLVEDAYLNIDGIIYFQMSCHCWLQLQG